jgi:hypothetical protein
MNTWSLEMMATAYWAHQAALLEWDVILHLLLPVGLIGLAAGLATLAAIAART